MSLSLKRTIAGLIVCFKPHVFLTISILLVVIHSILVALERGMRYGWKLVGSNSNDITLTMTTIVLILALVWATFFIFMVRYELQNELESILSMFQCTKRGLRFLGVLAFHVILLTTVACLVSPLVNRSLNNSNYKTSRQPINTMSGGRFENYHDQKRHKMTIIGSDHMNNDNSFYKNSNNEYMKRNANSTYHPYQFGSDKNYLVTVYKIWLTAIVYAFIYLIIENIVLFHSDMSLIEFVHLAFVELVTRITGIDLSDYPAGEMPFNNLMRRRLA